MFKMTNNTISMVQGDSAEFKVSIADYPVEAGDKIVFTVKDVLSVEADAVEGIVVLHPEDTRDAKPGMYWYDVEFRRHDGEIYTIVDPHIFTLIGDITVPEPEPVEPDPIDDEEEQE